MSCRTPMRELMLKVALKQRAWDRYVRAHKDQSLEFRDDYGRLILVTPWRPKQGVPWRATWFDGDEPAGHALALSHRDACDRAREYGALLPEEAPVP